MRTFIWGRFVSSHSQNTEIYLLKLKVSSSSTRFLDGLLSALFLRLIPFQILLYIKDVQHVPQITAQNHREKLRSVEEDAVQ